MFIRICRLDGTSDLFGPAPQSEFDAVRDADRAFSPSLKERPAPDEAVEAYLAREIGYRSRRLDRRGRGSGGAEFPRYRRRLTAARRR